VAEVTVEVQLFHDVGYRLFHNWLLAMFGYMALALLY